MNHAFLQYKKAYHRQPMLRSVLCSCEGLSQGFAARAIPLQFSLFRVKNLSSAFKKINNNNNNNKNQHLPCGVLLRLQGNSYIINTAASCCQDALKRKTTTNERCSRSEPCMFPRNSLNKEKRKDASKVITEIPSSKF